MSRIVIKQKGKKDDETVQLVKAVTRVVRALVRYRGTKEARAAGRALLVKIQNS